MDKQLLGFSCLTGVAALALLVQNPGTGVSAHPGQQHAVQSVQTTQVQPASGNDNVVAATGIVPVVIPNKLAMVDMVDAVIETSVQQQESVDTNKAVAETQQLPVKVEADFNTGVLSEQQRQLFGFRTLLKPDGYRRPAWQDINVNFNPSINTPPTKPFIVMIDPGHGGSDPGAKGYNGLLEKNLTLDIARRVRLFLSEVEHIDVRLTRNHDYGLSRQARVDAINRSGADVVISLHFNHLPQSQINLVESFYAGPENITQSLNIQRGYNTAHGKLAQTLVSGTDMRITDGSERLARTLQQHVFSEVQFDDSQAQNAGVKQETLFVLTRSFTPGVLMEISCLSHTDEADRLLSEDYRNRLAAALVDGIRSYHNSLEREPLKKTGDIGA